MSFLKRFLSDKSEPKSETQIRMGFWKIRDNEVLKEIQYVGYSPRPTTMRIEITCEWSSSGLPMLFLVVRFAEGLAAQDGYLMSRWHTKDLDSGFSPARIDRCPDGSSLIGQFDRRATGSIISVLASGEPAELWFGSPTDDLLRLPLPPEGGLESLIEEASKHPAAMRQLSR